MSKSPSESQHQDFGVVGEPESKGERVGFKDGVSLGTTLTLDSTDGMDDGAVVTDDPDDGMSLGMTLTLGSDDGNSLGAADGLDENGSSQRPQTRGQLCLGPSYAGPQYSVGFSFTQSQVFLICPCWKRVEYTVNFPGLLTHLQ